MNNEEHDEKRNEDEQMNEEDTDTVAASVVRATLGDEAAKGFKDFFGDWF